VIVPGVVLPTLANSKGGARPLWLDILTPKNVRHPRKLQKPKSAVNGRIRLDPKLENWKEG